MIHMVDMCCIDLKVDMKVESSNSYAPCCQTLQHIGFGRTTKLESAVTITVGCELLLPLSVLFVGPLGEADELFEMVLLLLAFSLMMMLFPLWLDDLLDDACCEGSFTISPDSPLAFVVVAIVAEAVVTIGDLI